MSPILITGVGQRVGLHLARTFIGRGEPVIGTYRSRRDSIDELESLGVELHRCDFYDDEQTQALINDVSAQHDRLRAIIHNSSDWLPDNAGQEKGVEPIKRSNAPSQLSSRGRDRNLVRIDLSAC